ncbi:hypothetical protein [Paenibacillus montanisoli]|uniref:Uncharacterized protein n=1 Tax=Paenibacillus montanisoli TaxID=2081970 RepID=A0A328U4F9_9BACL|nr:hypothetical protein [Paenibacillus montanisoli]RAP77727.1 hypothetical protein DL346_04495 [Paenibacillus montanisoli]
MNPIQVYTLTPGAAQQYLQNDGLDALGLTGIALSPKWSTASPGIAAYDDAALTLTCSTDLLAPFRGMLEGAFAPAFGTLAEAITSDATVLKLQAGDGAGFPSPTGGGSVLLALYNAAGTKRETVACTARAGDQLTVVRGFNGTAAQAFSAGDQLRMQLARGKNSAQFTQASGEPLLSGCTVFRLHPQAYLRLEHLMKARFGEPAVLPVPACMVIRNKEHFETDQFIDAGAALPLTGTISFHDNRGLIIDPIYVASAFTELIRWRTALQPVGVSGSIGDTGGIQGIASLASTTLLHFVNPHGANFQPAAEQATMEYADGGGNPVADIPAGCLLKLPANHRIQAKPGDEGRLRWGWALSGVMKRTPLTPPALPAGVTLGRPFYRVCVVDLNWHLLGNRTDEEVLGVRKDDGRIPPELLPVVRDQVNINYLADGPDTLAESKRVLSRPNQGMVLAVSMQLDPSLLVPDKPGATAHWPAYPATADPIGNAIPASLSGKLSAAFVSAGLRDVVVTVTGVPAKSHVRIYPQQFVEIAAIAEEPSFLRGDGGANIAGANPADPPDRASILLSNPFRLAEGGARPDPAVLTLDIVITPRGASRRLFGAINVEVGAGPISVPPAPFTGAGVMGTLLTRMQGIGPSPLFGVPLPAPQPAGPAPSNFLDLVARLAAEPSPRQSPRLPTMARHETIIVTGTTDPGVAPTGTLLWEAVLSGARWAGESLSAKHDQGNPGNPAGPDVHAAGVKVSGALAYDAAVAALRRVQPMIPWPSTDGLNPGWIAASMGDNFNVPDDSANLMNTGSGVLLRTAAVASETPLLSDLIPPAAGLTVQQLLNNAAARLGLDASGIAINIHNEPRLQQEIRREFFISKHGLRDAQWSLLRAFHEARELIYIESPQFARTARPGDVPAVTEVDLVETLAEALTDRPNLKIILCLPRLSDFADRFKGWSRQHFKARNEAVGKLRAIAPDRVAVFHPVGFPGRQAAIRTTSIIVDDVWSLVGTAHFRRRGMTFDGSASIASFDRELDAGYSKKVQAYRRALMAQKLRVADPANGQPLTGDWVRLAHPESAFALVQDLLAEGGHGRIQPYWPGPADNAVMAATDQVADPDGSSSDLFLPTFAGMLQEIGD